MYLFWRWRDLGGYRQVALGIAVVALLGIDAGVVAGHRGHSSVQHFATEKLAAGFSSGPHLRAQGVVSGHHRLWVLVRHVPRRRYSVEELRPSDFRLIRSTRVPTNASAIYFGAGRVWVSSTGRITAIDPASGDTRTRDLGWTVDSMAFRGSTAYAVDSGRNEVLAITAGRRLRIRSIEEEGGPVALIALRDAIEVTNRDMNLVPVIFRGADTTFLAALQLGRPVIAAAGPQAVWVRRGHQLVLETVGGDDRPARRYFRIPGRARLVLPDEGGGCYVAVAGAGRPSLLYIARSAIRRDLPRPFATRRGVRVTSFALDPAGGIAYTTFDGRLQRWVPPLKWLR